MITRVDLDKIGPTTFCVWVGEHTATMATMSTRPPMDDDETLVYAFEADTPDEAISEYHAVLALYRT